MPFAVLVVLVVTNDISFAKWPLLSSSHVKREKEIDTHIIAVRRVVVVGIPIVVRIREIGRRHNKALSEATEPQIMKLGPF